MAPKRSTPLDNPPSASSDDEETEEEQEHEESESEEESDEEIINHVKNPIEIENPRSRTDESSSDLESESEEEEEEIATPVKSSVEKSKTLIPNPSSISESETDFGSPTASAFTIKPSKKITPEKSSNSKRHFSESDTSSQKKLKVSNGDIDDEQKSMIKRIWNDDDELMLLQGFIDYQSEKGCSPLSDMDGFYRFIMDSLPGNASKNQVYEKIRRLKKKYLVNSEKTSGNGDDLAFTKPHECKLFELSTKIWGNGVRESGAKSKIKQKIEVKEDKEDKDDEIRSEIDDFETLYPNWNAGLKLAVSSPLSLPEDVISFIKKNLSLIGEDKAKEMDEKWKGYFENESLLRLRRVVLLGSFGELVGKSLGK